MIDNKKNVFWQAFLSATLIFGVGILLGFSFEQNRNASVEKTLLLSEVNVLDSQMIYNIGKNTNLSCDIGIDKVIDFADEVYLEAKRLEDYEENSQFTDVLEILHKRYDLLRLILWQQAILLKERCGADYHTIVYFYQFKDPDLSVNSQQIAFSRVLAEIKGDLGQKAILIPIAGDLNLKSIEIVMGSYGINSYPSVIVDEVRMINDLEELKKLKETF